MGYNDVFMHHSLTLPFWVGSCYSTRYFNHTIKLPRFT